MSRGTSPLKEAGTCRVFFSSPFGGMEEEREELTRRYLPQVHSLCARLGLRFVAVDMRWGITSQAADNAQVISICLRELDRSDMFVGFFGQRYGWHGAKDALLQRNLDQALGSYPWLQHVRDRSVTELEFLHGHLNQPGRLPAFVCFRDKAYDEAQRLEGERLGDKKLVAKYSSESDHASAMLADLKRRVEETRDTAARLMFEAVWRHLTEVLLHDFRPMATTRLQRRRGEHEAFLSSHTALYLGGQAYLHQLDTCLGARDGDSGGDSGVGSSICPGVVVTGPRGSGKSALLCNWLSRAGRTLPHLLLLPHFVGVAPNTTDPVDILNHLLGELENQVQLTREEGQRAGEEREKTEKERTPTEEDKPKGRTQGEEDKKDELDEAESKEVAEILGDMATAVGQLRAQGRHVVLVLDGLDKVRQHDKTVKHLFWLPKALLGNALTLVVSTLDSDSDTLAELLDLRHFRQLEVQPLDSNTQKQLCVDTLKESGKELSEEQLQRVLAAKQTANPLFLKVVLFELSVFGYFRKLDEKIDSLIACKDVTELLQQYLQRLEEDYNGREFPGNLVQQVLGALALARRGLSESELMEMWEIPQHVWSPLYFALERYVIHQGGLLRFAFPELQEAVTQRYLADDNTRKEIIQRMMKYFQKETLAFVPWESFYQATCQRASEELPWLFRSLGDKEGLAACLVHLGIFAKLMQQQPFWLMELWNWVGESWGKVSDLYAASADQAVVDCYLHKLDIAPPTPDLHLRIDTSDPCFQMASFYHGLSLFFAKADFWAGRERFLERHLHILEGHETGSAGEEHVLHLLNCRYDLACVHVDSGRLESAEKLHLLVLEKFTKILERKPGDVEVLAGLARSNNGLGVLAEKKRDWACAEKYFQESLRLHRELGNDKEVGECYNNLGIVALRTDKCEEALNYFQQTEQIYEKVFFGQLPPDMGNLVTNIGLALRKLGRLDEARAAYNRSLEIKANAVGWKHVSLAATYTNLGMLEILANDHDKAEQQYRRALELLQNHQVPANNLEHVRIMENLIVALLNREKFQEALPIYRTIFEVYEATKMEGCIPSVHQDMLKYLLQQGLLEEAERLVLALLESPHKDPLNFLQLDHLDKMKAPDERPSRAPHLSLRHALELYPGDIRVTREVLIGEVIPKEDKEELFRLLAEVDAANPDFGHTTYSFGAIVCRDQGHPELAVHVVERGLTIYPDNNELRVELLESLRGARRWEEAAALGEKLLPVMADNASLVFVTGHSALQAGLLTRAMELLSQVASMADPDLATKATALLKILNDYEAEQEEGTPDVGVETSPEKTSSDETSPDKTPQAQQEPNDTPGAQSENAETCDGQKGDDEPSFSESDVSDTTCAQQEEKMAMARQVLKEVPCAQDDLTDTSGVQLDQSDTSGAQMEQSDTTLRGENLISSEQLQVQAFGAQESQKEASGAQ